VRLYKSDGAEAAVSDPVKDTGLEVPIPEVWRPTPAAIVESLVRRDTVVAGPLKAVEAVSDAVSQLCLEAVDGYGGVHLVYVP
jgi:hypothetical protein